LIEDRSNRIEIILPVNLYEEAELTPSATPIGILAPREKLKVLRIKFGDKYMHVKVQRKNGDVGWMIYTYESADMNNY
jgi:hypothetical protein